ncbi:hypothetical protein ACHHRT_04255 [Desulfurivibrio sp. D14AmB]|uniref:hypothetical protein n=1 Tax=Desulfurivibrio sp. D14AmB TaxID=3374370 RepID=UPI00376F0CF9
MSREEPRYRLVFAGLLLGLVWTLLLAGCGAGRPTVQTFPGGTLERKVESVAVLPFIDRSGYGQGGKIVQRLLVGELVQSCNWRVALEGDIMRVYRQVRLRPWEEPDPEQLRIIAARLGVDLLITGEILEMEERVDSSGVDPLLLLQLRVYDGQDGARRWATRHRRQGGDYQRVMHFGTVNTISAVSRNAVREILEEWRRKGLLVCPSTS